jgi:hypothetical protein
LRWGEGGCKNLFLKMARSHEMSPCGGRRSLNGRSNGKSMNQSVPDEENFPRKKRNGINTNELNIIKQEKETSVRRTSGLGFS